MRQVLLTAGLLLPLALDTFALAAALGVAGLEQRDRLRVSLVFTAFEAGTPIVGLALGRLIGGVLAQNAVYTLWTAFGRAAEAAQGLIPVLTLRPSLAVPIASRNGEISWQPVLEITGWTTRDPAVFGPRTVPPPQIRLGSDGAAAAIAAPYSSLKMSCIIANSSHAWA